MNAIDTSTLADDLTIAIAAMRKRNARSRTRTIETDEVDDILASLSMVLDQAGDDDIAATLVVRGGYVPNSYRGAAQSDEVHIRCDLTTGAVTITAERVHAQSRSRGEGPLTIGRLVREGQSDGRVVLRG